ncbi:MAG TPA: hypothetical protein VKD70_19325 [Candidatus Acidoferrum sp.]|nr:hypothetical protein [Candidatus Acidoferrum sp.]
MGAITPFALEHGDELRSIIGPPPAKYGTPEFSKQAEEIVSLSGSLTDRQKAIVEFWCNGSDPDELVANWFRFAEFVSARDHQSGVRGLYLQTPSSNLDDDVKMYFALSNALLDASIATWDAKRFYDTARPTTTIPLLSRNKNVKTRGEPGKETTEADGGLWIPYQPATSPTPPSPEFPSEESALSAVAAEILARFSSSDRFGDSATVQKGSSHTEPGIAPQETVTLKWEAFTNAADEAGMSARYAGIHSPPPTSPDANSAAPSPPAHGPKPNPILTAPPSAHSQLIECIPVRISPTLRALGTRTPRAGGSRCAANLGTRSGGSPRVEGDARGTRKTRLSELKENKR